MSGGGMAAYFKKKIDLIFRKYARGSDRGGGTREKHRKPWRESFAGKEKPQAVLKSRYGKKGRSTENEGRGKKRERE